MIEWLNEWWPWVAAVVSCGIMGCLMMLNRYDIPDDEVNPWLTLEPMDLKCPECKGVYSKLVRKTKFKHGDVIRSEVFTKADGTGYVPGEIIKCSSCGSTKTMISQVLLYNAEGGEKE